jgi:hypothetical protein
MGMPLFSDWFDAIKSQSFLESRFVYAGTRAAHSLCYTSNSNNPKELDNNINGIDRDTI